MTLYHGDALAIDTWLEADVLVTDPPFGIRYNSGARRETLASSIIGDEDTAVRDAVLAAWGGAPALVFGTWRASRPANTRALLVWDTKGANGMGDLSIPWKPSHQEIYVLGNWVSWAPRLRRDRLRPSAINGYSRPRPSTPEARGSAGAADREMPARCGG